MPKNHCHTYVNVYRMVIRIGCFFVVCVQTINILIVNQSITDMCASFFTLLTAVVKVDGTRMSADSTWDQFLCRIWLTRGPLWYFLVTSTYGILVTALERYIAVVYPIWYKVRIEMRFIGFMKAL